MPWRGYLMKKTHIRDVAEENLPSYLKLWIVLFFFIVFGGLTCYDSLYGQSVTNSSPRNEGELLARVWYSLVEHNSKHFPDVEYIKVGDEIIKPGGVIVAKDGDHLWAVAEELMTHYALWHRWNEWKENYPVDVSLFLSETIPEDTYNGLFPYLPEEEMLEGTPEVQASDRYESEQLSLSTLERGLFVLFLLFFVAFTAFLFGKHIQHLRKQISEKNRLLEEEREKVNELSRALSQERTARSSAEISSSRFQLEASILQEEVHHLIENPIETFSLRLPEKLEEKGWGTCLTSSEVEEFLEQEINDDFTVPTPPKKVLLESRAGSVELKLNLSGETGERTSLRCVLKHMPGWKVWVRKDNKDHLILLTGSGSHLITPNYESDVSIKEAIDSAWDDLVIAYKKSSQRV